LPATSLISFVFYAPIFYSYMWRFLSSIAGCLRFYFHLGMKGLRGATMAMLRYYNLCNSTPFRPSYNLDHAMPALVPILSPLLPP
jgi:hypothetical protein